MRFSSLIAAATAALVADASTPCYTVHSGWFSIDVGGKVHHVGLSKSHELTYGTKDAGFKVNFQACPTFANNHSKSDMWTGRIVVPALGNNQCLTVESSTKGGAIKVATCTSTTKPSVAQTWDWGMYGDPSIFWAGSSTGPAGTLGTDFGIAVVSNTPDTPALLSGNRIQMSNSGGCMDFVLAQK